MTRAKCGHFLGNTLEGVRGTFGACPECGCCFKCCPTHQVGKSMNMYTARDMGRAEAERVLAIVAPPESDDNAIRFEDACFEAAYWPEDWNDDAQSEYNKGFSAKVRQWGLLVPELRASPLDTYPHPPQRRKP